MVTADAEVASEMDPAGTPESEVEGVDSGASAEPPGVDPETAASARPRIQGLGRGPQTVYLVDHGDSYSIYAEKVPIAQMVDHLATVGGPELNALKPLEREITLSIHQASMADIYRRHAHGDELHVPLQEWAHRDGQRDGTDRGSRVPAYAGTHDPLGVDSSRARPGRGELSFASCALSARFPIRTVGTFRR